MHGTSGHRLIIANEWSSTLDRDWCGSFGASESSGITMRRTLGRRGGLYGGHGSMIRCGWICGVGKFVNL